MAKEELMQMSGITRWYNPTDKEVRVKLFSNGSFKLFVVPAKGFKDLDDEFDRAIHELNPDGVVIGGKAPQLVKDTERERQVHVSLIPGMSEEKLMKEKLGDLAVEKAKLENVVVEMQKKMLAAEKK